MRDNELQGNISINEFAEIESGYSIEDSKKAFLREREEEDKNFSVGEPILFNAENAELCYPVKKDKNGQPITETDENGNEFYVRDEDKKPYIKFQKYNTGRKAVANVQVMALVDMMDKLVSKLEGKQAEKVQSILDTCFPCSIVNFGTFTLKGDRVLNEKAFHILQQSKIVLYSLPIMEKDKSGHYVPKCLVYNWIEKDKNGNEQEHSIDIYYYHGQEINGAQIGYSEK